MAGASHSTGTHSGSDDDDTHPATAAHTHARSMPDMGFLLFNNAGGANPVGGHTFTLRLEGDVIPASTNANYYSGQQKRKVHLATFWEDNARTDNDGPGSDIQ